MTETVAAGTRTDDSTRGTPWRVLAVLCTAQLMIVLDTTIVNIALPSAQKDLGWRPKHTAKATLKDMIEAYRANREQVSADD